VIPVDGRLSGTARIGGLCDWVQARTVPHDSSEPLGVFRIGKLWSIMAGGLS